LAKAPNNKKEWFLYDDEKRMGPFNKNEILDLLKNKTISEETQAVKYGSDRKNKLSEYKEFSEEIKKINSSGKNLFSGILSEIPDSSSVSYETADGESPSHDTPLMSPADDEETDSPPLYRAPDTPSTVNPHDAPPLQNSSGEPSVYQPSDTPSIGEDSKTKTPPSTSSINTSEENKTTAKKTSKKPEAPRLEALPSSSSPRNLRGKKWYVYDDGDVKGPLTKNEAKNFLKKPDTNPKAHASCPDTDEKLFAEDFQRHAPIDSSSVKTQQAQINHTLGLNILNLRNFIIAFFLALTSLTIFLFLKPVEYREKIYKEALDTFCYNISLIKIDVKRCRLNNAKENYSSGAPAIASTPVRNGIYIKKYKNGNLAEKSTYINNILTGPSIIWYRNKKKKEECNYKQGGRGICKGWYKNGNKKFTGTRYSVLNSHGKSIKKRDGIWKYWDKKGKFIKFIHYRDGKKLSSDSVELKEISNISLSGNVSSLLASPDNRFIAISTPEEICIYELFRKKIFKKLERGNQQIQPVFSPDNKYLLFADLENLNFFQLSGKNRAYKIISARNVTKTLFSPSGQFLIIVSGSNANPGHESPQDIEIINIYDTAAKKIVFSVKEKNPVLQIEFSPDSKYALLYIRTTHNSGRARIIDMKKLRQHASISYMERPESTTVTADSKFLKIKNKKSTSLYSLKQKKTIATFKGDVPVQSIRLISRNKKVLFTTLNEVSVYDLKKKSISPKIVHSAKVLFTAINRNGNLIASGAEDSTMKIYNIKQKNIIANLKHSYPVTAASFSPNSRYIISYSRSNKVSLKSTSILFDCIRGKKVVELEFSGIIPDIQFSPDSRYIVTKLQSLNLLEPESSIYEKRKQFFYNIGTIYDLKRKTTLLKTLSREKLRSVVFSKKTLFVIDTSGNTMTLYSAQII